MPPDDARKTIMVLERDVLVRMVISQYLRDCGYRVIEGVSAEDVWTVLQSGATLDVVLSDVDLAGELDGFSLATRLRQTHPRIDVILTSGVNGAAQKSTQLCEDGPIRKPYSSRDVEARIRALLERRRVLKDV